MKIIGIIGAALCSAAVWANSSGAPGGRAGVPGEGGTCAAAGCHAGTALNGGGGNVSMTLSGGTTYTPGVAQTVTVTIVDSAARVYGMQAASRLASSSSTQAGTFRALTDRLQVECWSTDFLRDAQKTASGCPASAPLEYITHSRAEPGNAFTFEWTPPATANGNVILYVAANAANGNGSNSGDRIYSTTVTLTPAVQTSNRPAVRSTDGVLVAGDFYSQSKNIAPGSWVEIRGDNFHSGDLRIWQGTDFVNLNAPTTLEGVSVSVGGKPAFMYVLVPARPGLPSQINAQIPDGLGNGAQILTVKTPNGTSDNYTINLVDRVPSFLAPAAFKNADGRQYIAAVFEGVAPLTFVCAPNSLPGIPCRSAKAGDNIQFYGVGFGSTTPDQGTGRIVIARNDLPNVVLRFGTQAVTPSFAGLATQAVGLYQFNITVPTIAAGDYELSGSIGGVALPAGLFINLR
ncbi:MAG: hypothetical protein NTZ56_03680 [Acidobacteria bacterium]|nr:hypothetical protein [Acidobacteriota bacterium]